MKDILIVDDEKDIRDLIAEIFVLETQYLQDIGDTASAALSYQEALQEYPNNIPLIPC